MSKRWKKRIKALCKTEEVFVEIGLGFAVLNIIYMTILALFVFPNSPSSIIAGSILSFLTMMPYYIKEVFYATESRFDEKKEKRQDSNQQKEKSDDVTHAKESLLSLTRRMEFVIQDEETFQETFGEGLALLRVITDVIQEHQSEKKVLHYIQYNVIQKIDSILTTYEQMREESKQQANRELQQLFRKKRKELHDCYLKQKEEELQQTFQKQIKELAESKHEYVYLEE